MMRGLLGEFRDFVLRGNVVELAVAVVVGAAFGALVSAFTSSFVTPLIAAAGGKPEFGDLAFTINGARFRYGLFLDALVAFLIVAAVVFFLVVKPVNALAERRARREPAAPATRECPECLSGIPVRARRCAFCASAVAPRAES